MTNCRSGEVVCTSATRVTCRACSLGFELVDEDVDLCEATKVSDTQWDESVVLVLGMPKRDFENSEQSFREGVSDAVDEYYDPPAPGRRRSTAVVDEDGVVYVAVSGSGSTVSVQFYVVMTNGTLVPSGTLLWVLTNMWSVVERSFVSPVMGAQNAPPQSSSQDGSSSGGMNLGVIAGAAAAGVVVIVAVVLVMRANRRERRTRRFLNEFVPVDRPEMLHEPSLYASDYQSTKTMEEGSHAYDYASEGPYQGCTSSGTYDELTEHQVIPNPVFMGSSATYGDLGDSIDGSNTYEAMPMSDPGQQVGHINRQLSVHL